MTSEAGFLPELHEKDAPDEIRAIYAEIRHLTGVPMVALIWRHLATLPGVLPDAWSSLAPLMRSGVLQETAWQLAQASRARPLESASAEQLAALGVDATARRQIVTVLDAYNRANPVNMLCVYTLFARLVRPDGQALAPDVVLWTPPAAIAALPRMFEPAEMDAALRRTLERLSTQSAPAEPLAEIDPVPVVAIPSLYRHLPTWPGYVDWIARQLTPRIATGELQQAITKMRTGMAREAEAFVVNVPPALALQALPAAKTALTRFSTLIPEMIVVGQLLKAALPPAE